MAPPAEPPVERESARARWLAFGPPLVALALAIGSVAYAGHAASGLERAAERVGPGEVATELRDDARRTMVVSFVTSASMLLLAVLWWRLSRRQEAVVRKTEHERHLASLGEMSAVLAHEIRNPLAALKGHAQLMVEMTKEGDRLRTKAERVVHEALRLEQLTNDLLTFVRSGRLRRDETEVGILVRQVADAVGGPDVVVSIPEEGATAAIDRVRVLQLLENLVRNAAQHGKPPIEVTVATTSTTLEIRVRDHGPGIPEDRRERIFEPFVTDATRGTGLGLAVVRRVAELHGGTATAENHPGGGAVFVVRLPRRPR